MEPIRESIKLYVQKYVPYVEGMNAAFAELTPLTGQPSSPIELMLRVCPSDQYVPEIELLSGDWLVQARLPSGETITKTITVPADNPPNRPAPVIALEAAPSQFETRGWSSSFSADFRPQRQSRANKSFGFPGPEAIMQIPWQLEIRDRDQGTKVSVDQNWPLIGGEVLPEGLLIRTQDVQLPENTRAFLLTHEEGIRRHLALPLPWPRGNVIEVRQVPRDNDRGSEPKVWILDPSVAPIMSFLEASDTRPARLLANQTAVSAETLLASKEANPLAATIGALALLRLRESERLHNWPYNLAEWFPWLPDGAMIAAYCALRIGSTSQSEQTQSKRAFGGRSTQAIKYVHESVRRGAPYFAESARLLREVCQVLTHTKTGPSIPSSYMEWSDTIFQAISPDSFVATYETGPRASFSRLLAGVDNSPVIFRSTEMSNEVDDFGLEQFTVTTDLKNQFDPILAAIRQHSRRLLEFPEAIYVRPGFQGTGNTVTPVVVLGVMPPLTRASEKQAGNLSRELNIAIELEEAPPQSQVAYLVTGLPTLQSELQLLLEPPPLDFRPPLKGKYEPPDSPKLEPVESKMKLTIATSPDAGWAVLRDFLSKPINKVMNIGIYQFTAEHVYKVLRRAMLADDDSILRMTIHPNAEAIPENGTKSEDVFGPTLINRLERALGGRFQHALTSIGKDGEFASAYHIKVIVADKKRFWLSSGNLQSSNQPPFDPLNDDELPPNFQRSYNREHHVVIENADLAEIFAGFLEYDFQRATDQVVDFASFPTLPDLIVPTEPDVVDFAPPRFFKPLELNENVKIQPILTPDNYAPLVAKLIKSAKSRLWVQNQYINLNPTEDFPEFKKIINLINMKIKEGLDVRIICRDLMAQEKLDMLLALGFPRDVFRFMTATHTKVVIVDDDHVLIGSHNLSNEGVVSNRDASVIISHPKAVEFCAEIFEYDWDRRATAKPKKRRPRVARPGEQPTDGAALVSWSSVFDEVPRPVQPLLQPRGGAEPFLAFGGLTDSQVTVNGIDANTGKLLISPVTISDLAGKLRGHPEALTPELMTSVNLNKFRAFGLPDSIDPDDIRKAGWGIVVPEGRDDLFDLVRPLWEHRAKTVPPDRLKKLTYRPNESVRNWLKRHGMAFGTQLPTVVPYHLLLVASPQDISFEFQYLLDLEYAVGRLWFDKPEYWKSYCDSVVATETTGSERTRQIAWFAPRHDPATTLSHDELVTPLIKPDPTGFTSLSDFESIRLLGADATRDKLLQTLRDQKPAFVFTASHGIGYPPSDPNQKSRQGALLTADWQGGSVTDKCLAAEHLDCDVRGMIAFLFACFGAGTPLRDNYPLDLTQPPLQLTDSPFVAALPQKLLSQGALAVVGHVDRAWGCSIRPAGVSNRLGPFRNFIDRVLRGRCVGNSTRDFSERSSSLSAELLDIVAPGGTAADDDTLVGNWIERNDARSYILLGDPSVRISVGKR